MSGVLWCEQSSFFRVVVCDLFGSSVAYSLSTSEFYPNPTVNFMVSIIPTNPAFLSAPEMPLKRECPAIELRQTKKQNMRKSTLFESNCDLPELLSNGVFVATRVSPVTANIELMQNFRLVSKACKESMDTGIVDRMQHINALATECREKMLDLLKANSSVVITARLLDESTFGTAMVSLKEEMMTYFPLEVVSEYIMSLLDDRDDTRRQRSLNMLHLHATVSMFFCMATRQCYIHMSSGVACKKTCCGSKSHFCQLEFSDKNNIRQRCCVYSTKECVASVCEHSREIRYAYKKSFNSRLALEMKNVREYLPEFERLQFDWGPPIDDGLGELPIKDPETSIKGFRFVLNNADLNAKSIQHDLGLSDNQVDLCRLSVKRKDEEAVSMAKSIFEMNVKNHINEIGFLLSFQPDHCGPTSETLQRVNCLSSLHSVYPGIAWTIKAAVEFTPRVKHCMDMELVRECLNSINWLSTLRKEFVASTGKSACNEAYEYMTGMSCGALYKYQKMDNYLKFTQNGLNNQDHAMSTVCEAIKCFENFKGWWFEATETSCRFECCHPSGGFPLFVEMDFCDIYEKFFRISDAPSFAAIMAHARSVLPAQRDEIDTLLAKNESTRTGMSYIRMRVKMCAEYCNLANSQVNCAFKLLAAHNQTRCLAFNLVSLHPQTIATLLSAAKSPS